jgi:hypothetical protein
MAAVLAFYGTTMLTVQVFERNFAVLAAAAQVDPRRPAKKTLEREVKFVLKRHLHLMQTASASELLGMLNEHVSDELIENLRPLIKWRNRLAHTYLWEALDKNSPAAFDLRVLPELIDLHRAFELASGRLIEELDAVRATWADLPSPPPGVQEAMTWLAGQIMRRPVARQDG